MKLKSEVRNLFQEQGIFITKQVIAEEEKHFDSPLRRIIPLPIILINNICVSCSTSSENTCLNCARVFCKKHMHAIISPIHTAIYCLCINCRKDMEDDPNMIGVEIKGGSHG